MRALTVRQPWASLLVQGIKPAENRTWDFRPGGGTGARAAPESPGRRITPTWVAIHAATEPWRDDAYLTAVGVSHLGHPDALLHSEADVEAMVRELPRGVVVGAVEIDWTGPVDEFQALFGPSPFATGPRCWHVARAVRLLFPGPIRGALGLWALDPTIVRQLHLQVDAVRHGHAALDSLKSWPRPA